jgi:tetratricopeptide (TPR) repeat protein
MIGVVGSLFGGVLCSSRLVQDKFSKSHKVIAHNVSENFPKNHDAPRAVLGAAATALEKLARSETRNFETAASAAERAAAEAFEQKLRRWTSQWRKASNEDLESETVQALVDGIEATLVNLPTGPASSAELQKLRAEAIAAIRSSMIEAIDPPQAFLDRFDGKGDGRGFFAAFAEYVAVEIKTESAFQAIFQVEILSEIRLGLTDVLQEARAFERRRRADANLDAGIEWLDDILTTSGIPTQRPSAMVLAKYRLMQFTDFDGRLSKLVEWACNGTRHATEAKRSVAGRLYVGDGGVGKTRLSIEIADELDRRGWEVARISSLSDPAGIWRAVEGASAPKGILVIIDYVEAKKDALQKLAFEAERLAKSSGPNLRILVLSRSAQPWWESALSEKGMEIFERVPFDLGQAKTGLPQDVREQLFDHSVNVFRGRLQPLGLAGDPAPRPDLSADTFERPISIAFAAYLTARGESASSGLNLISDMMKEEERGWRRYLAAIGASADTSRIERIRRGAAQITLLQGADAPLARACIRLDTYFGPQTPAELTQTLAELGQFYPADIKTGDTISALEPDILGERLVADVSAFPEGADLLSQTLAAASDFGTFPVKAAAALQVLIRGTTQHPEAETRERFHQFIDALTRDILQGQLPIQAIRVLSSALPYQTTALRALAVAIETEHLRSDSGDMSPELRAGILNNLGNRHADLGNREDAMLATQEAVELYRSLALKNPDAFNPDLAMSLNNLGIRHAALGNREDAMKATQEAVELYRSLAQKNPDAFNPDLAMSLNNLGNRHANLGNREDAMLATQAAVDIRRELARKNPDAFNPDLAMSLNNLGVHHAAIGNREDAMKATQAAVDIRRELARKNPDAFNPDLAMSLSSLGDCYFALQDWQSAKDAYLEAAKILRPYFEKYLDRYGTLWMTNCIDLAKACLAQGTSEGEVRKILNDLGMPDKFADRIIEEAKKRLP